MSNRITLSMLATLLPLMASAQDRCTAQYEAEQARIIREFSGQRPPKGDRDAEVTWSKNLNDALAASAKRAEDLHSGQSKACFADQHRQRTGVHRCRKPSLSQAGQAIRRAFIEHAGTDCKAN